MVDPIGGVIAGHARLEAAKLLGLAYVPTICLDNLTEVQIRAYLIADNRLAETADWDLLLLAGELKFLCDLEFDATLTGFETTEIDLLLQEGEPDAIDRKADELPDFDESAPAVSRIGDLWKVGPHRLLCGDATKRPSFKHLLLCEHAQMVISDPPYNVRIDGNVSGLGAVKHREFLIASGEMSEREFIAFLRAAFGNLVHFSADGSIHYIFGDWRHLWEFLSAARGLYSEFKNLCVWNKGNGGMGSMFRSQHELVFVFKNGKLAHINNVELGRFGRNRTNVWNYPRANSLGEGQQDELAMHPTVKPVAMIADAILDCSKRGGIILDCFGGSGTTLIAAEKTGRHARLMELDPIYVDLVFSRVFVEIPYSTEQGIIFA